MDNTVQQYQRLGNKTLFVFIIKRSFLLVLTLLALLLFFIASKFIPDPYAGMLVGILVKIIPIYAILFVVVFLGTFLLGWLEYIHYKVFLDEESFKVTRGLLNEEELGVPYRRIKEVRIERSIADQLIGVSNITVTVLGEVEGQSFSKESEIILPAIDKNIAAQIQNGILKKSGVEQVIMAPSQQRL